MPEDKKLLEMADRWEAWADEESKELIDNENRVSLPNPHDYLDQIKLYAEELRAAVRGPKPKLVVEECELPEGVASLHSGLLLYLGSRSLKLVSHFWDESHQKCTYLATKNGTQDNVVGRYDAITRTEDPLFPVRDYGSGFEVANAVYTQYMDENYQD